MPLYNPSSSGSAAASYLVYTALLTQSGTDAPVATVLENTLGGTVVWAYGDVGNYTATATGKFTANKTVCFVQVNGGGFAACGARGDNNIVDIVTSTSSGNNDDVMGTGQIEIRVYP